MRDQSGHRFLKSLPKHILPIIIPINFSVLLIIDIYIYKVLIYNFFYFKITGLKTTQNHTTQEIQTIIQKEDYRVKSVLTLTPLENLKNEKIPGFTLSSVPHTSLSRKYSYTELKKICTESFDAYN